MYAQISLIMSVSIVRCPPPHYIKTFYFCFFYLLFGGSSTPEQCPFRCTLLFAYFNLKTCVWDWHSFRHIRSLSLFLPANGYVENNRMLLLLLRANGFLQLFVLFSFVSGVCARVGLLSVWTQHGRWGADQIHLGLYFHSIAWAYNQFFMDSFRWI